MLARTLLETLIPLPRRREVDHVDLARPASFVWNALREGHVEWPFSLRALLRARSRAAGSKGWRVVPGRGIASLLSTAEQPGFHLMGEEPGTDFTVGAIAAMRMAAFEFLPVSDSNTFRELCAPGFVKMAWRVSVAQLGTQSSRLHFELRLDATDRLAWRRFRRSYVFVGPVVRLVRRHVLASLADQLGVPELSARHRAQGFEPSGGDGPREGEAPNRLLS